MKRETSGIWDWAIKIIAIGFVLFQLYTAGFGLFPNLQQRCIHAGFAFVIALAIYPARKGKGIHKGIPIWDLLFIAIVIVSSVYIFTNYEFIMLHPGEIGGLSMFLAIATVVLALECGRRTIGMVFPVLVAAGVFYVLFGHYIPGKFGHGLMSPEAMMSTFYLSDLGVWGFITGVSATIVAMFIIFGALLIFSGGGETFARLGMRLVGRSPGGPAKMAVVSSSLFGTISGAAIANVAVTGSFTIPMMKRLGYEPEFAGAVEASASTGGQLMPPIMGTGAFVMAELLGIPYLTICVAAILPAALYYTSVFSGVHFESMRRGLAGVPDEEIPSWGSVLTWSSLAPIVIPIGVLLAFLTRGYTPTTAGFYACMAVLLLYIIKDVHPGNMLQRIKELPRGLEMAGKSLAGIVPLIVCANIFVSTLTQTGLGIKFSELIMEAASANVFLALLLGAAVALILGMGLPTVAAYIVAAAVVAPSLITLGLLPLTAHMFVFYFAIISAITPPVCVAIFIAQGISGGSWVVIAKHAILLTIVAYLIPFFFATNNILLAQGEPLQIAIAGVSGIVGCILIGAGLKGYLTRHLNILSRLLLGGTGLLLLIPGWETDLIGCGIIALFALIQFLFRRWGVTS